MREPAVSQLLPAEGAGPVPGVGAMGRARRPAVTEPHRARLAVPDFRRFGVPGWSYGSKCPAHFLGQLPRAAWSAHLPQPPGVRGTDCARVTAPWGRARDRPAPV